jgi:hypothetical protein
MAKDSLFSSGGYPTPATPENAPAVKNARACPAAKPSSGRARQRAVELIEELAKESAAIAGTGRAFRRRCRRDARFKEPPAVSRDRNTIARIWFVAEMIERKSYARQRGKRRRNGLIGKVGLELLRTMLYRMRGDRLYPSYDKLDELTPYRRRAIVRAVKVLERLGFITVHRRCKWVTTPYGRRMVQDSNAYQYHLPRSGLGAILVAHFVPASSECTGSTGTKLPSSSNAASSVESGRWWLVAPVELGDGRII